MGHHADHAHGHRGGDDYSTAFIVSIALNTVFVLAEFACGFVANSTALMADAGHNLSDVLGLGLAWWASMLARRPPGGRYTYGLRSSSILAALANAMLLMVACGAIALEAFRRFAAPPAVAGRTVMLVAAIGIVVNGLSAWLFMKGRKGDLNIRGAFLHMAADAAISLGVVAAGTAIALTGMYWIDPATSLAIVAVIVAGTWGLLRDSTRLALSAIPAHIDAPAIDDWLRSRPGVSEIHDLHIWGMSTTESALTVHLVMPDGHPGDEALDEIAHTLRDRFSVQHSTLQVEHGTTDHVCMLHHGIRADDHPKRTTQKLAFCLCGALLAATRPAPADTNLTLRAALELGERNNPGLRAAYHQWQGAVDNIAVEKALPDPVFSYGFESPNDRLKLQSQDFGLSQELPAFGKLSAMKSIATDMADAARQRYMGAKLDLDLAIAEAYAELYYQKRSIAITKDLVDLIQDVEEVARTRYAAGSPMASVLQAQVELGRLEDSLKSLSDRQHPLEARLYALLDRPADAPLAIEATLPYRPVDADAAALGREIGRTSPELMEMAAEAEQGRHQLLLARRERLPNFMFEAQYKNAVDGASMAGGGEDSVMGTVGITLPLWLGKNRGRIESAANLKAAAELGLEGRKKTLEADLQQALFDLRDADRKINLYKESLVPKAEQSLQVNRQGYESGSMEFINLIDAERVLLEFELAYERALADHLVARARLARLTGIDFLSNEPTTKGTAP